MRKKRQLIGLIGVISTLLMISQVQAAKKPVNKPNIIYILADDLGYADLLCYGQNKIETPNIDRLSASGMRFFNHYSGTAVSGPTRCILLTGKHSGHAYIRCNDEMKEHGDVWSLQAMLDNRNLKEKRCLPELLLYPV